MPSGKFRFGLFTFDVVTRELRREHILVHLQSQPAQVLGCLIERAGQVVSREELRNAVWGNGTFVDFDRGLNFCITQIRSALGDDPAGPTYIQTLPKRGYQFIAPVTDQQTAVRSSLVIDPVRKIVGRRDALAQLDTCLDRASGSQRQVVFITG